MAEKVAEKEGGGARQGWRRAEGCPVAGAGRFSMRKNWPFYRLGRLLLQEKNRDKTEMGNEIQNYFWPRIGRNLTAFIRYFKANQLCALDLTEETSRKKISYATNEPWT